jgi:tetratricopeptide (TPR) repeat protein
MKFLTINLLSFLLTFLFSNCVNTNTKNVSPLIAGKHETPNHLYYETLLAKGIDSVCSRIKDEVPPHWWRNTCEGFFFYLSDTVSDATLFRLLDNYDKTFPNDTIYDFSQLIRGRIFIEQAAFDTALYCLQDCYTVSQRSGRIERAIDAVRLIGRCYMKKGDFPQGIEYLLVACAQYESFYSKDKDSGGRVIETLIEIADAYKTSRNYEKAQYWYQKALDMSFHGNMSGYQITSAGRFAENYLESGNISAAKQMIDSAFYLQHTYNNPYNEAERYYILACIEKRMGKNEKALQNFKYAHAKNETKDNVFVKYKYLIGMGEGFEGVGKYDSAMRLYQIALATPDSSQQVKVLALMSDISARIGNYEQALKYQKQSNDLENRLFNAEKNKAIGYLEAKSEMAQKEWQLKQREQEFNIKRLAVLLTIVLFGFILTITVFWSVRQHQKRVILEQEMEIIKAHEQLRIKELSQTTQNLNAKRKALDAAQKVIELKNELIEELELKSNDGKRAQDITNFRNTKILTTEDWHKFRNLFDKTFPTFDEQQKRQFPSLTNAEIRLLMLLKIGFNNSEIAYALGISVDSVYKSRYRLRRKIGITEEYDLEDFAKNF